MSLNLRNASLKNPNELDQSDNSDSITPFQEVYQCLKQSINQRDQFPIRCVFKCDPSKTALDFYDYLHEQDNLLIKKEQINKMQVEINELTSQIEDTNNQINKIRAEFSDADCEQSIFEFDQAINKSKISLLEGTISFAQHEVKTLRMQIEEIEEIKAKMYDVESDLSIVVYIRYLDLDANKQALVRRFIETHEKLFKIEFEGFENDVDLQTNLYDDPKKVFAPYIDLISSVAHSTISELTIANLSLPIFIAKHLAKTCLHTQINVLSFKHCIVNNELFDAFFDCPKSSYLQHNHNSNDEIVYGNEMNSISKLNSCPDSMFRLIEEYDETQYTTSIQSIHVHYGNILGCGLSNFIRKVRTIKHVKIDTEHFIGDMVSTFCKNVIKSDTMLKSLEINVESVCAQTVSELVFAAEHNKNICKLKYNKINRYKIWYDMEYNNEDNNEDNNNDKYSSLYDDDNEKRVDIDALLYYFNCTKAAHLYSSILFGYSFHPITELEIIPSYHAASDELINAVKIHNDKARQSKRTSKNGLVQLFVVLYNLHAAI